jgi:hypothetical protein
LNVNESVWQAILDREKNAEAGGKDFEQDLDLVDDETDEEEEVEGEFDDDWGDREFVSDISGDEDGLSDLENITVSLRASDILLSQSIVYRAKKATRAVKRTLMTLRMRMKIAMLPLRLARNGKPRHYQQLNGDGQRRSQKVGS